MIPPISRLELERHLIANAGSQGSALAQLLRKTEPLINYLKGDVYELLLIY